MLEIKIPGRDALKLEVLVLDYNGTISLDGKLLQDIREDLVGLAQRLDIFVVTADTHGTVKEQCKDLPVRVKILDTDNHTQEKADFITGFGERQIVAIGNGANDELMLREASLGIVVIGPEGCSVKTMQAADIAVTNINSALSLLLNPKRVVATLRR